MVYPFDYPLSDLPLEPRCPDNRGSTVQGLSLNGHRLQMHSTLYTVLCKQCVSIL